MRFLKAPENQKQRQTSFREGALSNPTGFLKHSGPAMLFRGTFCQTLLPRPGAGVSQEEEQNRDERAR